MTLEYRTDERGGFTVGNVDSGRASYAQPNSVNATKAKDNPEAVAQTMNAHQAAHMPQDRAAKQTDEKLWDHLNEGGKDGSTKNTEAKPKAAAPMDASDNTGPRQANEHTHEHLPPDGLRKGPSDVKPGMSMMPGGGFAVRSTFTAQWPANRPQENAAPQTPERQQAATPARQPTALEALKVAQPASRAQAASPSPLDALKAAQPAQKAASAKPDMLAALMAVQTDATKARVAEASQSRAAALAKALKSDGSYAS